MRKRQKDRRDLHEPPQRICPEIGHGDVKGDSRRQGEEQAAPDDAPSLAPIVGTDGVAHAHEEDERNEYQARNPHVGRQPRHSATEDATGDAPEPERRSSAVDART